MTAPPAEPMFELPEELAIDAPSGPEPPTSQAAAPRGAPDPARASR